MINCEAFWGEVLGGPYVEVAADESELGRKKKGLHGHDNTVLGNVRGVFERGTGRVVLELYEKLHSASDERRFVPPNAKEACEHFVVLPRSPFSLLMMQGRTLRLLRVMDFF